MLIQASRLLFALNHNSVEVRLTHVRHNPQSHNRHLSQAINRNTFGPIISQWRAKCCFLLERIAHGMYGDLIARAYDFWLTHAIVCHSDSAQRNLCWVCLRGACASVRDRCQNVSNAYRYMANNYMLDQCWCWCVVYIELRSHISCSSSFFRWIAEKSHFFFCIGREQYKSFLLLVHFLSIQS